MYFVFIATYRTATTIIIKLMSNLYPVTLKVQHKEANVMVGIILYISSFSYFLLKL